MEEGMDYWSIEFESVFDRAFGKRQIKLNKVMSWWTKFVPPASYSQPDNIIRKPLIPPPRDNLSPRAGNPFRRGSPLPARSKYIAIFDPHRHHKITSFFPTFQFIVLHPPLATPFSSILPATTPPRQPRTASDFRHHH
jgi:hypothetical protein